MTEQLNEQPHAVRGELLAERGLSIDEFWAKAEDRMDWPLSKA